MSDEHPGPPVVAEHGTGGPAGDLPSSRSGTNDPPLAPATRGGFVLAFVVFMLFAVSVAAATGYLVVSTEFTMAENSIDGAEALVVARAGLERFVAEQLGVVGDSVSYALGDGVALVTARRLFARDSVTEFYYVRSEGTVTDVFAPASPARRVVGAYAIHRRRPLAHHAVLMISSQVIDADAGGTIRGYDHNSADDCSGGGAVAITAAIARGAVTEDTPGAIQGSPASEIWSGGYTQMLDSIGLRWDVLADPDFPFEFDHVWPSWSSLPADSFPAVRRRGWTTANGVHGRGVLIVDGIFDGGSDFSWEGIILAKDVDDYVEGDVRGILVGGLEADNSYETIWWRGDAHYYSCHVYRANESLSYLELVENTVFETY